MEQSVNRTLVALHPGKYAGVDIITPIHKNGPTYNKGNYRTISVLCALSKIVGRHVYYSLYAYLMVHSLLHGSQSVFHAKLSCETALIHMVHKWTQAIDKELLNGVVLLDLRKAFDLVNHTVLLEKLSIYGCSEQAMRWFSSYMSELRQIVQFKDTLSNPSEVITGVTQGSILGPLLFNVFMNYVPLSTATNVTVDMYADDYTITATGTSIQSAKQSRNNDLQELSNWRDENRMVINAEKTKTHHDYYNLTNLDTTDPDVWIKGDKLQVVESEKLLGLKIYHFLT